MSGSKPGERRGGRQKGTPNKTTKDIRELAQKHGPAAIARAAHLMLHAESEDTQLRAAQFLTDRGYGKAVQPVAGADGTGPVQAVIEVVTGISRAPTD